MRSLGPAALVVGIGGCAGAGPGINSPAILVQSEIRELLDAGEITDALTRAVSYERRAPGPESWSWLGRALWRSGELLEAESFFRRAVGSGSSEGVLGLARAAAALGRLDEAGSLAEQLATDERTRARALRLLAALAWRQGNSTAAAQHLSAAAEASEDPAAGARLANAAAAAATMPQRSGGAAIIWNGFAGTVPLERDAAGAPIVVVRLGGATARLRLSLQSPRSTLSPELVGRVGLVVHGDPESGGHAVVPVELGDVTAAAVPFVLQPVDGADGELGFDVISTLGWELWLSEDRIVIRPPHPDLSAATDALRSSEPQLRPAHWIDVRVPIDGLEAQLLLFPRLLTVSVAASIDLSGPSRISRGGLAQATVHDAEPIDRRTEETVVLATRLGGFGLPTIYRVESYLDAAPGSSSVAPQAVLGVDFAAAWGLRWSPELQQLSLVVTDAETVGLSR